MSGPSGCWSPVLSLPVLSLPEPLSVSVVVSDSWLFSHCSMLMNSAFFRNSRELTNGYRIRRGAIDHNTPLMTNVRLAKAYIEAFTAMTEDDIKIKSWQEYNS